MTRRLGALAWLAVVVLAGTYLLWRVESGLSFRSDILALLPAEQRDEGAFHAQEAVTKALSRQFVLLIGDPERTAARDAAKDLGDVLAATGLTERTDAGLDTDRIRQIGALYARYREGLLSEADRNLLLAGKADTIATKALSQVFGFVGMGDARLLRQDPFLLLPSFLTALPLPMSRLAPDEGMLTTTHDGKTWVLIAARLTAEPFALDVQQGLAERLDPAIARLRAAHPDLEVLRTGAVFFAKAGAEQAMGETSTIGIVSTAGIVVLVLLAYRALAPLWLSLLAIGVGVLTALAGSLLVFGELHVGALLFGVSLIGVATDYSLQYCTEAFTTQAKSVPRPHRDRAASDPGSANPTNPATSSQVLGRVFWGITLGASTTVVGYLTLMLAPFPGLHQLAAFSAIGLTAAWLTVVLWYPFLDRARPARHGAWMLEKCLLFLWFWQSPALRRWRMWGLAALLGLTAIGLPRFHTDDDVRRMQALSPDLVAQQDRLRAVTGSETSGQFFLISASNDETALQAEEALGERLAPLVRAGVLADYRSPARYVPSTARQQENRALRARVLTGAVRSEQFRRLGLTEIPADANDDAPLTLAEATRSPTMANLLSLLVAGDATGAVAHVVMLDGVRSPDALAHIGDGIAGVRFVDSAGSFSELLGKYRQRAMLLLVLSAVLMLPLLAWRYGLRHSLRIMLPPLLAVALTPGMRALGGAGFSFFDAIALVLVLSVGVDYAVFLRETTAERLVVTMLAVVLAAATALMSFGLLALSQVNAVAHFGATMLIGVLLAALLAPLARR